MSVWQYAHMDKPLTRKLIAEIPEELFRALKIRSAETDRLMRDLLAEALRAYLGTKAAPIKPAKK